MKVLPAFRGAGSTTLSTPIGNGNFARTAAQLCAKGRAEEAVQMSRSHAPEGREFPKKEPFGFRKGGDRMTHARPWPEAD
ncbi:MAG: hypothetical protein A3H70_03390 [Candidatus Komeilibacteria bacterium RIFCSPLOWO2_02_FULL_48_11]|uniref:Uncharacterized protein n=1 Tax=Candidatus Komeilibacteria bacterium RIFCSPLOWO2_02_FULL_48_11 TaxID=1798553 RepID=A0A1G2BTB3_9BACT|nr:MAG: hypothetical protein A3H70_03390 [Candidatus Komeilibacteria bacterium RIFCSPLOWO2_02_FULL_48_11]